MKKVKYSTALLTLAILLPASALFSSFRTSDGADEYAVKAMFVYNFTRYFDWSSSDNNSDFVISVFGNSEISGQLEQIVQNRKVNNRNLIIKQINSVSEIRGSQILFISKIQSARISEISESLKSSGTVIIAEDKDMAKKGAHINLVNMDGKIKFELNETLLKRDNIKFSNDLHALAIIIN